jgi:4-amino-4-deoxy-L-arabinose transferase-like glycosyltransferase
MFPTIGESRHAWIRLKGEIPLTDRDTHAASPRSPWPHDLNRRDVWILGALLIAAVLLPILVGMVAGTLDIPRNDDWSYRGIATRLFTTGRLELDGAAETAVLGQVLLTQPLLWLSGGTWWAFLVAGVLFGTLAVVGGYLLVRRFLDRASAAIAVGSLVFFPAYLAYAISYMTDVPALACQFGCLGFAAVAIGRRPISGRWLAAALIVGCVGFSIREFALAAPAAVLAVLFIREPARPRTWLVILATGLACFGILVSRFLLPGQLGNVPWELRPVQALLPPAVTVSFVLSPVGLLAALRWRGIWKRRDVAVGGVLGVLAVVSLARIGIFPHVLLYDLITQWGSPSAQQLIGDRPKLVSDALWWAVAILASIATVVVFAVIAGVGGAHLRLAIRQRDRVRDRLGSTPGLVTIFVLMVAAGLTSFGMVGWLYDRYLWPAIPPLAALLLYVPRDMRSVVVEHPNLASAAVRPQRNFLKAGLRSTAVFYAGVLAVMSLGFLLNANAFDGARWRAAESLVALGTPASLTDAGPEWVSSHQSGFATVVQPGEGVEWWQRHWPSFRLCAFVTAFPAAVPGASLVKFEPDAYRLFLFMGPQEPFYLYEVASPDCP